MATKKRTGLGRGIGALIPTSDRGASRPSDVFFDSDTPAYPTTASTRTNAGKEATTVASDAAAAEEAASLDAKTAETGTETKPPATRASRARASTTQAPTAKVSAAKTPAAKSSTAKAPAGAKARTTAAKAASGDPATPKNEAESKKIDSTSMVDDTQELTSTSAPASERSPEALDATAAPSSADSDNGVVDGDGLIEIPGATLRALDPSRIVPNAHQPRTEFDEAALQELIISVREFGVLQPIVVRPIPADHPLRDEADFELIMGERRLRATKAAGLSSIPAVIRNTEDDVMLRDALLENLHRSQLNPLEEASAYQQLLNDFGITQEVLAERIGRSRPQISNTLRLLRLPLEVQRRVAAGVLSAGHARAILSAGEPAAMQQLADKIVNEDLSVRSAEAAAAKSSSAKADTQAPIHKEPRSGLTGYLDEIGEQLGDRLNTRVKVTLRRTKGQIVVDFASIADLNRILEELGESAPGK